MDATAASPLAADRAATYTRPPRRASACAVARPIPVFPPVTRNVCSLISAPAKTVDRYLFRNEVTVHDHEKTGLLDRDLLVDEAEVDALAAADDRATT